MKNQFVEITLENSDGKETTLHGVMNKEEDGEFLIELGAKQKTTIALITITPL